MAAEREIMCEGGASKKSQHAGEERDDDGPSNQKNIGAGAMK